MYALDDYTEEEMETVDVYIVPRRKADKVRTHLILDKLASLIGLIALFPVLTSFDLGPWTISVPSTVLPPQILSMTVPLAQTGQRTIPAVSATGTLVISNGSIIVQYLRAGFIVASPGGVEIATDAPVTIPASDGVTFGMARVQAHAVVAGQSGNIAPLAINSVIESSLFVRNKEAFTGGMDARIEQYATKQDRDSAYSIATYRLGKQITGRLTNGKCAETVDFSESSLLVEWKCAFLLYRVPDGAHVIGAKRDGDHVVLTVGR